MQRVISINLGGNAYQLEEDGYNALFAYLDAFETSLQDSPEREKTLAGIEQRIADKCQALLGPGKTVVTSAEISSILASLSPVPPQADAPKTTPPPSSPSGSSAGSSSSTPASSDHRRLYQIREGAMISGVAVGLSEFLHIDVTLIRILFVVFALVTSGWGILAYGVLMFVVPKVDTRAQASGGAGAASAGPYRWPWDEHGWPWEKHGWPWDRPAPDPQKTPGASPPPDWRSWRAEQRAARRAARMHHPGGTMMMIFFLMLGFFWLSFWTRGHFFFGWPFFWGFPHWIGIIFFFLMLRLIFMPFRMARWGYYGPYGPYSHPHYAWASMWNGFAWFMLMIFVVWLAYHYVPEFHNMIRDFQTTWRDDFNV
jgi:phage shock protein PspC (stress-responsive transcriptional regulator)